ncbi:hypothetical protein [Thalassobacillus pellis]|uniref:hypothetical protein n=1 Tax=Thalassobacillus pellis TaxID=748008 RepID=UPI00195F9640|nr:hypothetical protein [Thalassobacillus pellis]MBM7551730.1 hypothetical protein [Thalassobacillus pellis]
MKQSKSGNMIAIVGTVLFLSGIGLMILPFPRLEVIIPVLTLTGLCIWMLSFFFRQKE